MPDGTATVLAFIRYAVFAIVAGAALSAVGSWAVRTRRLNPFSRAGRLARRISDLAITPMETWVLRRGGNPQNAGWWLVGVTLVGGIVLISVMQWLLLEVTHLGAVGAAGPRAILRLAVYYASQVVLLALILRVIGSWVGVGRYNRWMRPAYWLTDWIVQPLKRVIPPLGMIDITPLVAWFLLLLIRGWVMAVI